jgi:alcohol dehydrogenase class IV
MAMSGLYPHVAHGEALACVYPAILRYSWDAAPARFAALARILDPALQRLDDRAAAERSGDAVEAFLDRISLRICLRDLRIPEAELAALARASLVLPDYKNHPRVAAVDDVHALLKLSCETGTGGR